MSVLSRPLSTLPALQRCAGIVLAVLVLVMGAAAMPARADDLQDANALLRKGQHAQALDKINAWLASRPRDAQGRFLKGLILTEQNKSAEAIDVFTRLTQDYPELPEPYNNLAVLFAAQGQYEKARQSLEQSIRTHPSYATAYENLGDVYTKLASQAYDKALQLDSSNSAAKSKLSLVRDMIGGGAGSTRPAKPAARPVEIAKAEPKAPPVASTPSQAPAPKPEAKAAAPEAKADAKPAAAKPAAGGNEEIVKTVRAWAQAWASKDVKGYLSYYARDFKTPKGEARGAWEKDRTVRIQGPKQIEVGLDNIRVTKTDDDSATVTFRQSYRSDRLKANSTKTLVLERNGGKWQIQQERVGS